MPLSPHDLNALLSRFPRISLTSLPTPVEYQPRLSEKLGIELLVKRDDLTGLAFGGNKVRQLEYYFGAARMAGADLVLITGAVQSNYVRLAAAAAARLGMGCHIQLEERVDPPGPEYRTSGNVLLDDLLGAVRHSFPAGEDEEGADARLAELARDLSKQGRTPYVIPLGPSHPPLGALGYVTCALELHDRIADADFVVLGSGSGYTHAGLLFGLRALGWAGRMLGICVRRAADLQGPRIAAHCANIAGLLSVENPVRDEDVEVRDDVLAPGYGVLNTAVEAAIRDCAELEGLLTDPVYTGRTMAGLFRCVADGTIPRAARVLALHTGGQSALFAYETALRRAIASAP